MGCHSDRCHARWTSSRHVYVNHHHLCYLCILHHHQFQGDPFGIARKGRIPAAPRAKGLFVNHPKIFNLILQFSFNSVQKSEEKGDEQKEYDKITTDECASYGTVDNDQEVATRRDVSQFLKVQKGMFYFLIIFVEQEFVLKPLPVQEPEKRAGQVPMMPDSTTEGNNYIQPDFDESMEGNPKATLREYLLSIVYMPHSLRMVCLTNLFCWMAHVCYSLYFTDFVGEAVYGGDPQVDFDDTNV